MDQWPIHFKERFSYIPNAPENKQNLGHESKCWTRAAKDRGVLRVQQPAHEIAASGTIPAKLLGSLVDVLPGLSNLGD
jgi:hypothetical protein